MGAPVAATDADNDVLTYTLGGADAASFYIDADTGQMHDNGRLGFRDKGPSTVLPSRPVTARTSRPSW